MQFFSINKYFYNYSIKEIILDFQKYVLFNSINLRNINKIFCFLIYLIHYIFMIVIGDGGLGIGDWGLGIGPNPQSPNPNPQSPIPIKKGYLN